MILVATPRFLIDGAPSPLAIHDRREQGFGEAHRREPAGVAHRGQPAAGAAPLGAAGRDRVVCVELAEPSLSLRRRGQEFARLPSVATGWLDAVSMAWD